MRSLVRRALGRTLCLFHADRIASARLDRHLFAVGYHSVSSSESSAWHHTYSHLSFSRERFAEQIAFLAERGHSFITLKQIFEPLPPKPTVVFFDDGFRDVLTEALPILRQHRATATVHLSTGLIDRTHVLWTMRARHAGLSAEEIRRLKRGNEEDRDKATERVSLPPRDLDVFLDWDDVRELSASGIEIGAHGVSHRKLTACDPRELHAEISGSADRIERELGSRPQSFSYPHARYDERVVDAVQKSGFRAAIGGRTGLNRTAELEAKRFVLRKVEPSPADTIEDFAARLYLEGPLR